MPHKTIAVFFTDPGFDDYPFNEADYREAYTRLGKTVTERGATFVIVRDPASYRGDNSFEGGWAYENNDFRRREETIIADVLFIKGRLAPRGRGVVVNDPALEELCTNKAKTYQKFSSFFPLTIRVESRKELPAALDRLPGERAVAKPIDGDRGRGVMIGPKNEIGKQISRFPYLLQEFMDTSGGIPGLVEGMHDFRIIFAGDAIAACYVRTPPPGKMLANVAQGGKEIAIDPADIPPPALAIAQAVDHELSEFPHRLYSVDLARTADGSWKIIELNSQPGAPSPAAGHNLDRFNDALADLFLAAA